MVTQQDVIKKFVESLDKTSLRGTSAVDEAVRACSKFTSYSDLMNHFLADRNNASSGDEFLKRYCGINLDNADTGAITGADAGGSVVKTAESIVPESGSGKSVYPPSNSFSYKGLTVNVPDASRLNDAQKNIVAGLYTWWLKSGLDLIEETYGISYSDSDTICKIINVDFDMGSDDEWPYVWTWGDSVTTIHINSDLYKNLKNSDENGTGDISSTPNLDRLIAYGLSRPLMRAKINYEDDLPSTIGKGISVLIDGYDDKGKNEISELVNNASQLSRYSISNSKLDTGIHSDDKYDFAMGYMLLRYLAKQETDPTNIGNVTIPTDALEYNGHSYYLYSGVASTWEEAKEYCESLGGHLAVINNSAENTELFNYMKSKGYNSAYFGFSDAVKEGNWQWVDGSSVTYTNWANGEPNSENSNEDYAEFYYKFTDGKWNDGNFQQGTVGDSKVFICEWDTLKRNSNPTTSGVKTQQEVMKDFMQALDGGKSKDDAVKVASNGMYTSMKDLKEHFYNDLKANRNMDAVSILKKICGIDLSNNDTGAITGLDAGGASSKDDTSIVPEVGQVYHLESIKSNETLKKFNDLERDGRNLKITKNGLTLIVPNFYIDTSSFTVAFNGDKLEIVNGLYSWWLNGALDLVEESTGLSFKKSDVRFNTITLEFQNKSTNTLAYYGKFKNLSINLYHFSNLDIDKNSDGKSSIDTLDRTLAHELTHAVMDANMIWSAFWFLPTYLREGTARLTEGSDDYSKDRMTFLIQDYLSDGKELKDALVDTFTSIIDEHIPVYESFNPTFHDNKHINTYPAGYMLMRYFAKQTSENILPSGLSYDKNWTTITASKQFSGNSISLGQFASTVTKLNASSLSKTLNIVGNSSNNSIKGGKGADTLNGDSGDDTLTGGTGKDVFVYSNGNDVITDYKEGEDRIKLDLTAVTSSTMKGSDLVLTTNNGTLTVKGTKDKVVTFVDNNGKTSDKIFYGNTSYTPLAAGLTYDAKRTVLTASSKFTGGKIDLGEYLGTVTKINAGGMSKAVNIVGNAKNNSIKGGSGTDTISGGTGKDTILGGSGNDKLYGGNDNDILKGDAGNDSLYGGSGNDTLTGGAGADVFVYEKGNDVITDYKTGEDKIQLNPSAITRSTVKGSDVILTTSNGKLTIKSIKDKVITFVDSNGKITDKIFFADTSYSPLANGLTYDSKRTVLTVSNKFSGSKINLDEHLETVTKVNCSALSKSVNIIGNSSANSLKGGKGADYISGGNNADTLFGGSGNDNLYGGTDNDILNGDAGNDSLYGGSGNDTLTGGTGNDWFIYEGGNDVITDYKANEDHIKISSGKISKTTYKNKDVVFTIGSGTLTVKNAKGKEISVTTGSQTQTYSKTLDLLYDCNFMTDELQVDDVSEITANNYSVGQIQTVSDGDVFDKATLVSDSSLEKK